MDLDEMRLEAIRLVLARAAHSASLSDVISDAGQIAAFLQGVHSDAERSIDTSHRGPEAPHVDSPSNISI